MCSVCEARGERRAVPCAWRCGKGLREDPGRIGGLSFVNQLSEMVLAGGVSDVIIVPLAAILSNFSALAIRSPSFPSSDHSTTLGGRLAPRLRLPAGGPRAAVDASLILRRSSAFCAPSGGRCASSCSTLR